MPYKNTINESKRLSDMEAEAIRLFKCRYIRAEVTRRLQAKFYLSKARINQLLNLTELNQKYSVSSAGEQLTAKSTEVSNSATMIESARNR